MCDLRELEIKPVREVIGSAGWKAPPWTAQDQFRWIIYAGDVARELGLHYP
jgi:hypothetical protein